MSQKIFIVAAIGKNHVMGKEGRLPWPEMPNDWKRLQTFLKGKPTIMGRKTFESPQNLLSENHNLILTKQQIANLPANCTVVASVAEALEFYKGEPEICILGGASIYKQFLPYSTHMYLTRIHVETEGDAYFPEFSEKEWKLVSEKSFKADVDNPLDYDFCDFEKR